MLAWNEQVFKRTISGHENVGKATDMKWETLEVDLAKFKDKEVAQAVSVRGQTNPMRSAGVAFGTPERAQMIGSLFGSKYWRHRGG